MPVVTGAGGGGRDHLLRAGPPRGDPQDAEPEDRDHGPHEPAQERDQPEHTHDAPPQEEREEARRRWLHQPPSDRMRARDVADRVEERQREQQEQSQRDRDHDHEEQDRDERQQEEHREPEADRRAGPFPGGPVDRAIQSRSDEQEEESEDERGDRVADPPDEATREPDVPCVEPRRDALPLSGDRGAGLDGRGVGRDEVAPDLRARTNRHRPVEDDDITLDVPGDIRPAVEHDDGTRDRSLDRCRSVEDQRGIDRFVLRHDELTTQHDLVPRRSVGRGPLCGSR